MLYWKAPHKRKKGGSPGKWRAVQCCTWGGMSSCSWQSLPALPFCCQWCKNWQIPFPLPWALLPHLHGFNKSLKISEDLHGNSSLGISFPNCVRQDPRNLRLQCNTLFQKWPRQSLPASSGSTTGAWYQSKGTINSHFPSVSWLKLKPNR